MKQRRPAPRNRPVAVGALAALSMMAATSLAGCGAVKAAAGITTPPAAVTTNASLVPEQARAILSRVFTSARESNGTGAPAAQARTAAYTAEALQAAQARAKLGRVAGAAATVGPEQPGLLTVSNSPSYPRFLVAQTVPSSNALPLLHLLTSPDVATPFKIRSSAIMLPSSAVRQFAPITTGSPLVNDGAGLAVQPSVLLDTYAKALSFANVLPDNAPFVADRFLTQVRDAATRQARSVVAQSTYTQTHAVRPDATYAVGQADGSALVFGVLQRTDTFTVKPGQTISSPQDFLVLAPGKSKITRKATMTTLEFVVFQVPKSGTAERVQLVAAEDQLVAASGS